MPKSKKVEQTPPRRLKSPKYKSFRLQKQIRTKAVPRPRLIGSFRLFYRSIRDLSFNWRAFLGILLVYGILNMLLVQSFSAARHSTDIKNSLDQVFNGEFGKFTASLSFFAYLIGTSGNTSNPTAGAYQLILTIVVSLALIWTLRQTYAKKKVSFRDGFYRGVYPLVPFLLVLLAVTTQLLPFGIGAMIYGLVNSNGIATTPIEQIIWAVFLALTALLSLYMICSSILGLYIVCLPDMTPLRALRSARELVKFRRIAIMRRIIFLPISLFVVALVVVLPLAWLVPILAVWIFFVLSMLGLMIIHAYLYRLYRELLGGVDG